MKKFKILNLYACLGGNRYKWDEVATEANVDLEITAVEIDIELCKLYQERFPKDIVIAADAHQYLLDNYKKFDFIWSSPPCPSHSLARFAGHKSTNPIYPDLKLYEEIIFLKTHFDGKFCVENVIPYYEPLIPAQKRGRHLYWTNFLLPYNLSERKEYIVGSKNEVKKFCIYHEYDFYKYKGIQRIDKISRNLVDFEAGKSILQIALGILKKSNIKQLDLF
jgi:DNA (cytosine-5)-methyltransferase 1